MRNNLFINLKRLQLVNGPLFGFLSTNEPNFKADFIRYFNGSSVSWYLPSAGNFNYLLSLNVNNLNLTLLQYDILKFNVLKFIYSYYYYYYYFNLFSYKLFFDIKVIYYSYFSSFYANFESVKIKSTR